MVFLGKRNTALPLRQALPSRAPPRTQPHSRLAARGRREVAELLACSSIPSSDHTLQQPLFSPFRSTPVSSPRPRNLPRPFPVRATKAPQQLRHELSYPLNPSPHALTPCSSNPSRSPPTPAETLPRAPHRSKPSSEHLHRRCPPF